MSDDYLALKGMSCSFCLFQFRSGLTHWCDLKEEVTGEFSPACSYFIPNNEAVAEYKRRFEKRKKTEDQTEGSSDHAR